MLQVTSAKKYFYTGEQLSNSARAALVARMVYKGGYLKLLIITTSGITDETLVKDLLGERNS